MGIDVKEWAQRWVNEQEGRPNPGIFDTTKIRFMADLIRAVIADEAANLDGKTICTYPVVSEGDVPEWCKQVAKENLSGVGYYDRPDLVSRHSERIQKSFEAELSRRVAEATADKDRRIAELEKEARMAVWHLTMLLRAIGPAYTPCTAMTGLVLQVDNASCNLINERDSLKQQLAAAKAEVERLKQEIADLHEPPRNMNTGGPVVEVDICEASRISELESDLKHADIRVRSCERREATHLTELTKLREEVARLSRPVESLPDPFNIIDAHNAARAERNARESAEAERDELREFVRTRIIESWYRNGEPVFHDAKRVHIMSDANLDELLTAYRAEKAKVQQ